MKPSLKQEIVAFIVGILVGAIGTYLVLPDTAAQVIGHYPSTDEYHIHADFMIQIEEETYELGTARFMTGTTQRLHPHAHLHDEDGSVLHMHAEEISFVEFLSSLDVTLTDTGCLTLPDTETLCDNSAASIALYVNDTLWTDPFSSYVPADLDKVLLYYGDQELSFVQGYLENITNDACIYSGSCPERGTAPPESCGLTCEL